MKKTSNVAELQTIAKQMRREIVEMLAPRLCGVVPGRRSLHARAGVCRGGSRGACIPVRRKAQDLHHPCGEQHFEIGGSVQLTDRQDLTIIAHGLLVAEAIRAQEALEA